MADERSAGGWGARVTRTGLAVVHEGELILPAAGSEAQADQVLQDAQTTIIFSFPVEIEVRRLERPLDVDSLVERANREFAQRVESR